MPPGAPGTGTNSGNVACTIIQGFAVISWTDHEALAEGIVVSSGGTQADLAALYQWWTANSSFRG